jgi:hypothetical protein
MPISTSIDPVFVFGSNLAGRHGKGAALWARQRRGAIYGQGAGPHGNAYAIPTKARQLRVLALNVICDHVRDFLDYAQRRLDLRLSLRRSAAVLPDIARIRSPRCSPTLRRT